MPNRQTDIIERLISDHREVETLFTQYEALGDRALKSKTKLASKIIQLLTAHSAGEEGVFYPEFRKASGEDAMILEAVEEHHLLKVLLKELSELDAGDEHYDAKMTVLKELVQHHVEEEEGEMFPKAREVFGERLQAIAPRVERAMNQAKREPTLTITYAPEFEKVSSGS